MKTFILLSILFISAISNSIGQTQDSYEYNKEFIWGINKNTYSGLIGGLVFKKSRKVGDRTFETYGLELINVRHPQEQRKSAAGGSFFIYGKSNYLYAIRTQYGRDFVLFNKAPQQGVEIKAVFSAGPTIGIVAPYYIEKSIDGLNTIKEQYDPKKHNYDDIAGSAGPFYGLGESNIQMGGNLKAALNFETGVLKSQVTGFEVGFLLEAYLKKVVIVPSATNQSIYPTLFLTIFYGSRR
jgi:hypothetical protein